MQCEFLNLDHSGWADIATTSGVAFAAVTLLTAYQQYRSSKRAARLVHVNSLFRDFLRLEFDFHNAPQSDPEERKRAGRTLQSYRMWVLEEMWIWLEGVRKRKRWTQFTRERQEEFVKTWDATLAYHAQRLTEQGWADFVRYKRCYAPGFYDRVMKLKPPAASAPSAT